MSLHVKDVEQRSFAYLEQIETSGSIFAPLYPPSFMPVAATEIGECDDTCARESFDEAVI